MDDPGTAQEIIAFVAAAFDGLALLVQMGAVSKAVPAAVARMEGNAGDICDHVLSSVLTMGIISPYN